MASKNTGGGPSITRRDFLRSGIALTASTRFSDLPVEAQSLLKQVMTNYAKAESALFKFMVDLDRGFSEPGAVFYDLDNELAEIALDKLNGLTTARELESAIADIKSNYLKLAKEHIAHAKEMDRALMDAKPLFERYIKGNQEELLEKWLDSQPEILELMAEYPSAAAPSDIVPKLFDIVDDGILAPEFEEAQSKFLDCLKTLYKKTSLTFDPTQLRQLGIEDRLIKQHQKSLEKLARKNKPDFDAKKELEEAIKRERPLGGDGDPGYYRDRESPSLPDETTRREQLGDRGSQYSRPKNEPQLPSPEAPQTKPPEEVPPTITYTRRGEKVESRPGEAPRKGDHLRESLRDKLRLPQGRLGFALKLNLLAILQQLLMGHHAKDPWFPNASDIGQMKTLQEYLRREGGNEDYSRLINLMEQYNYAVFKRNFGTAEDIAVELRNLLGDWAEEHARELKKIPTEDLQQLQQLFKDNGLEEIPSLDRASAAKLEKTYDLLYGRKFAEATDDLTVRLTERLGVLNRGQAVAQAEPETSEQRLAFDTTATVASPDSRLPRLKIFTAGATIT